MNSLHEIRTDRLLMRPWRDADSPAFAAINADPRVMEYFPSALSPRESDALAERIQRHWTDHGLGLWAIEIPDQVPFIGFAGLSKPSFQAHFTPCVEVGWRIAADHWGHGYATEAARASVRVGFEVLALDEIVSFTVAANRRSIRVMEKLGMCHMASDDFDHPLLPETHPFKRHVLYRLTRSR
jgi:RimJ/RimL family protein N-acetyltransferase